MALVDTLTILPPSAAVAHAWLVSHFRALMKSVVEAVDEKSGAWWQVMDQPGREGNYVESSGSAMFVYSLLKGVRSGYLDGNGTGDDDTDCEYERVAKRAHGYLVDTFVVHNGNGTLGWNGTVGVCSLNSTATYEVCSLISLACSPANANCFITVLRWSVTGVQQCAGLSSVRIGIARVREAQFHKESCWLNVIVHRSSLYIIEPPGSCMRRQHAAKDINVPETFKHNRVLVMPTLSR
jgi:hypothetical protein